MSFSDTDFSDIYVSSIRVSDALVFFINLFLVASLLSFPLFRVFAETIQSGGIPTTDISPTFEEDYTPLLTSIFSAVDRPIPDDAYDFVRDLSTYRLLVLRGVEENRQILTPLVVLVEELPSPLREEYRRLIASVGLTITEQYSALLPYFEGEVFLRNAVIISYAAYPSLLDRLFLRLDGVITLETLRMIRERSAIIRRDIALLYSRIQRERCLQNTINPSSCSGR